MAINFVTSNEGKILEADNILKEYNIEVIYMALDLPELQGDIDFVSKCKCQDAAFKVKGPVVTEDTSLCFKALKGLPGPYIKDFITKMGCDGLYQMLAGFDDKAAEAVCTLAYTEGPDKSVYLFQGIIPGQIVPPRGENGFGWDACFQPDGYNKTLGEMDLEEKNKVSHRRLALEKLRNYLAKKEPND